MKNFLSSNKPHHPNSTTMSMILTKILTSGTCWDLSFTQLTPMGSPLSQQISIEARDSSLLEKLGFLNQFDLKLALDQSRNSRKILARKLENKAKMILGNCFQSGFVKN
ncbi:hypothetical protein Fot_25576 [Forsythia ovata]|uniref:Uncharacterized protein n=1 Tax=Forsythia ovata TaxID=205694 RepID=A0ABD1U9F1_9LAMI